MDLNIGAALWLAAQAEGEIHSACRRYRSRARVVLLGNGADELCGGYGRHRTAFRHQVCLRAQATRLRLWKLTLGQLQVEGTCNLSHRLQLGS